MQFLSEFWMFIQDQVLGMKWLSTLIGQFLNFFGLDTSGKIGGSVQFFIYDVIKIIFLLCVLIFIISYIQSFFPQERTKKILGRFHGIGANILAALLGTVTPFCSCSSIPLFIGFTSAGLPLGVTFSFLISSPFVDLASTVLLASMFGWRVAITYVVVGVLLAILGGMIIGKLKLEKYIQDYVFDMKVGETEEVEPTKKERIQYAKEQVKNIFTKVWKYVLLGVGIGALIHNWIPQELVEKILGNGNIFAPVLAAIVGIPMYADIFGTMPIAEALVLKGTGIGTVLTFMMGVTALSVPSIVMLKQVMKNKLLGIFVGIISVGIIVIGYIFNIFQFLVI